jgi:predicted restriction endonuclease
MWSTIKKNDVVYFALKDDSSFSFSARVKKTKFDPDTPLRIWGNDFRSRSMTHLIFFDEFNECSYLYHKMLHHGRLDNPHPGLYEIQPPDVLTSLDKISKEKKYTSILPSDLTGPPPKIKSEVTRFIRDTQKTKELKKMYQGHCQICNYRLEIRNNVYYSEVHHLHPLHDGGDDDFNNMIVLCPTHHAEFDYILIGIAEDKKTILDRNMKKIGILNVKKGHQISMENILFHLQNLKNNES